MIDPNAIEDLPLPEQRQLAVGHDKARQAILAQLADHRLPGAIMIHGPEGIGKATLAFELAAAIFTATGDESAERVREQIAAGSHPNLSVLRRRMKEAKGFYTVIRVEDVRELRETLQQTRGRSGHRIAVLDSIDDCNPSAANALLKTLEEPPADTTFFLISHRPGGLLPTIKSRCHNIALRPLSDQLVADVVMNNHPELDASTLDRAVQLAGGRPRRAFETLALAETSPVGALITWLQNPAAMPTEAHLKLGDALGSDPNGPDMSFAREILSDWLASEMRDAAMHGPDRRRLASATELWEKANALLSEADSVNLDFKQTLVVIFDWIRKHSALSANSAEQE
ncbi:AAA family ATPase [Devosia sp. MC521]|uniref:AAA family ATPase n=1 Tax=Devosia sp. MC521 TaxID=2759954 RepID=UPI0015F9238B|nr:AAA family ATPase [Devosia sp. MC521]MBJ6986290.1 AAA family ATPase [Devosia sp. MC521]QMW64228.1 AAA family ATPase [Devosia sp. MC521]